MRRQVNNLIVRGNADKATVSDKSGVVLEEFTNAPKGPLSKGQAEYIKATPSAFNRAYRWASAAGSLFD